MAPLVLDPIDDIQLETIAAELSFFLEQDVKSKKMVGFVVEKRTSAIAAAAFDLGPLAVWPRPVPAELVTALLQAVDDENAKVRLEAIYATGVIAKAPLGGRPGAAADQGAGSLRPGRPRRGGARHRAAQGAEAGDALIKAVNDSQADVRYAAMRALGAIREPRAIGRADRAVRVLQEGGGRVVRARRARADRRAGERAALQGTAAGQGSLHPPRRDRRPRPRRRHGVDRGARAERHHRRRPRWSVSRPRSRCRSSGATTPRASST